MAGVVTLAAAGCASSTGGGSPKESPEAAGTAGEDVFGFVERTAGRFDAGLYRRTVGAANPFKEGDAIEGVAAPDEATRQLARRLLSRTSLRALDAHPLFEDDLYRRTLEARAPEATARTAGWTLGQLRAFLLSASEDEVKAVAPGLSSDVIACVVKLMTNEELATVGRKVWNPLPGSHIGARGYLGARIQPNSPTDDADDIVWQVFDGWSYGVGDVVLGTNPVSSDPASVARVEAALHDLVVTFGLEDVLPHCVLSHIDIQAEAEKAHPGTTGIWFQSLAGSTAANRTFDLTTEKMLSHAATRSGRWGLYFETGQGSDFTNGHGQGTDMVVHESRKYGFARLLAREVGRAQEAAGRRSAPWVHVNDVAGFIGPEVFRSREQLVRCCLEDIVMGKLHGLTIGLDVCTTLHMDVSLDDLDWCLDQVATAGPAYLMALPTKNDPMLGYLTTGFQDHVRLRETYGLKVDEKMWAFFQELGVVDADGKPGPSFGDPVKVYLRYRQRKGDPRPDGEIAAEGRRKIEEMRGRGVPVAVGHGDRTWNLAPALETEMRALYADAKKSIRASLPAGFAATFPGSIDLRTRSADRTDYILHPQTGEELDGESEAAIRRLRSAAESFDVQVVVSDGLNAYAISDDGHCPYLEALRTGLQRKGYRVAPGLLVVTHGRVRAGYRIGEILYGNLSNPESHRAVVHLIGERPGSMHHTFSAYITGPKARVWGASGETRRVDHDITRVVSGIADTALAPALAAEETVKILDTLT
ncbi:MAG: ethanolamine ammonia-lyase subunit EutB [Holophagales bacterium]|nr:ethanolamine ammonia-lyase subunit EutB [Holophagales bacterium]